MPGKQPMIELPAQPAAAAPVETAAPEPVYLPPEMRDPFWPVGYVPPTGKKGADPTITTSKPAVVVAPLEPPQWDRAIKTLTIKGIMKSGAGYIAMINGQLMCENDTISYVYQGRTYRWRIAKISEKGVQFERMELVQ